MRDIKALILAPFDTSYERVRDVIHRSLRKQSIQIITLDDVMKPGAILANAVTDAIRTADLIVADVSRKNPNVLYELGFAHALRKPTLLLVDADEASKIPFDLAGYQMVIYDPKNLTPLQHQISRFLDYQQSRWDAQS